MDQIVTHAYQVVLAEARVSVDELIATPQYRDRFLNVVRACGCMASERDLLMRLISLRKRSRLPRTSNPILPLDNP
jgi:hypothetical protein